MAAVDITHRILQIRRFGCRIALDELGTGYSSLSYMSRFPVDIVKIDQSFIRSLTERTGDIADAPALKGRHVLLDVVRRMGFKVK